MKFDLRYAFLVSAVIHAVFLQALGGALASRPQPVADAGSETLRLVFNLVDPVDFDPTRFADHTTRPDSLANDRGEGASATDGMRPRRGQQVRGTQRILRNPRISAESADGGRDDTRESWLQRREARVRESIESLATQIGIELPPADLATMQLAFPALYRFARAETVPSATTYRELLRTYIDLRMGYPHAVLPRPAT